MLFFMFWSFWKGFGRVLGSQGVPERPPGASIFGREPESGPRELQNGLLERFSVGRRKAASESPRTTSWSDFRPGAGKWPQRSPDRPPGAIFGQEPESRPKEPQNSVLERFSVYNYIYIHIQLQFLFVGPRCGVTVSMRMMMMVMMTIMMMVMKMMKMMHTHIRIFIHIHVHIHIHINKIYTYNYNSCLSAPGVVLQCP